MERRTTFRPEDQVIRPLRPTAHPSTATTPGTRAASPPPLSVEYTLPNDDVYGCLGSSKQYRQNLGRASSVCFENEDRIALGQVLIDNEPCIFAGLFDGHGGGGKASSFVSSTIQSTFQRILNEDTTILSQEARVIVALEKTFHSVDSEFYKRVKTEAERMNLHKSIRPRQCCKYFNENPCVCLNPSISANEGSTGTVTIVTRTHVYTANVGDSDAVIAEHAEPPFVGDASPNSSLTTLSNSDESEHEMKRTRLGSSSSPPSSSPVPAAIVLDQITVTDTPIPLEGNEDYVRIRAVAQKHHQQVQPLRIGEKNMPFDGILKSIRGDRFNYVAVPGARSLNMVRAFGNLGNKTFVNDSIVESESAIIARPHVRVVERKESMCALVLGSDGLWDNLERLEVAEVIGKHLSIDEPGSNQRTKECAKDLMQRAIKSRRKPDDVSIVIIPLTTGAVVTDG